MIMQRAASATCLLLLILSFIGQGSAIRLSSRPQKSPSKCTQLEKFMGHDPHMEKIWECKDSGNADMNFLIVWNGKTTRSSLINAVKFHQRVQAFPMIADSGDRFKFYAETSKYTIWAECESIQSSTNTSSSQGLRETEEDRLTLKWKRVEKTNGSNSCSTCIPFFRSKAQIQEHDGTMECQLNLKLSNEVMENGLRDDESLMKNSMESDAESVDSKYTERFQLDPAKIVQRPRIVPELNLAELVAKRSFASDPEDLADGEVSVSEVSVNIQNMSEDLQPSQNYIANSDSDYQQTVSSLLTKLKRGYKEVRKLTHDASHRMPREAQQWNSIEELMQANTYVEMVLQQLRYEQADMKTIKEMQRTYLSIINEGTCIFEVNQLQCGKLDQLLKDCKTKKMQNVVVSTRGKQLLDKIIEEIQDGLNQSAEPTGISKR